MTTIEKYAPDFRQTEEEYSLRKGEATRELLANAWRGIQLGQAFAELI
jgi:hypothetical protein